MIQRVKNLPCSESDCERWATSAWKRLGLTAPCDLQAVCDHLGIELRSRPLKQRVLGLYVVTRSGKHAIYENLRVQDPRWRRFTIAHEIGHFLILRAIGAVPEPGKICMKRNDDPEEPLSLLERRCNQFAGALLAPEDLTKRWFRELAGNAENRVTVMASRFQISPSALRIRLKELGLEKPRKSRRSLAADPSAISCPEVESHAAQLLAEMREREIANEV